MSSHGQRQGAARRGHGLSEDLVDLARRVQSSDHWRWLPGMRVAILNPDGSFIRWERLKAEDEHSGFSPRAVQNGLADLSDPGTLGAVREIVRRAWGEPDILIRQLGNQTEAEALAVALDAS